MNYHKLKIRWRHLQWFHFTITSHCNGFTLQWHDLRCNGYVAFEITVCKLFTNKDLYLRFPLSRLHIFTNKTTTFLDDEKYRKILSRRQDFYAKCSIGCKCFHNGNWAIARNIMSNDFFQLKWWKPFETFSLWLIYNIDTKIVVIYS